MRILHIIPNLSKGGAERLCLDICNELVKRETHLIKLVVLDPLNEYEALIKKVIPIPVNSTLQLRFLRSSIVDFQELDSIVKEFNPEVIHSHLFLAELYSKHINHSAKRFCHVHDNMHQLKKHGLNQLTNKAGLVKFYERKFFLKQLKKYPTEFICISKDAENFIKNSLPHSYIKSHFLPNAINRSTFQKSSFISDDSQITLCTIGSFVPKKGFNLIIDTILELKKRTSKKIKLYILGDGELRTSLESQIRKLNLNNEVLLEGKVDSPQDYLSKADLYIHGASYEPFGLVLIEAMSTGLPVIATDGKGNRDFMDGTNGIMLNHRDPKLFAKEIVELMEDPTRYSKLQQGANNTAKKHDIVPYVDRLLDLYQNAINEN